jgi:subtilisin
MENKIYIVTFYEKADAELITSCGGTIECDYEYIPNMVSAYLPDESKDMLNNHPKVKSIAGESVCTGQGFKEWGWGYSAVRTRRYFDNGFTGVGVKVAILDTGLSTAANAPSSVGWYDAVNGLGSVYDDHGHGSFVAGIIKGAGSSYTGNAKDCQLYIAKVWNSQNTGSNITVINGINWAISQGVHIINFSGSMHDDNETTVRDACRTAYNAGIIVVGISGNGIMNNGVARAIVNTPGKDYSVVAVGAVDSNLNRTSFSNYGVGLDLVAPGQDLISINHTGGYWGWQGTSFAAPFVAAHFACLKQKYPSYTRQQLVDKLYANVTDLGNSWELGRGLLSGEIATIITPTGLTANNDREGGFSVSWNASSGATGYDLRYRRLALDASWTTVPISALSTIISGLNFFREYEFQVRAKNSDGESNYSSSHIATTRPQTPNMLTTNTITHNSARFRVGAALSDRYNILRFYYRAGTSGEWSAINAIGTNKYVDVTGLTPNTSYQVRARTIGEIVSPYQQILSLGITDGQTINYNTFTTTTLSVGIPTDVSVTQPVQGALSVDVYYSWGIDATGMDIRWSIDQVNWISFDNQQNNLYPSPNYNIGIVSIGNKYFQVRSRRTEGGATVFSSWVNAMPYPINITDTPPRPTNWAWSYTIASGQNVASVVGKDIFIMSHTEWNNFTARINQFRLYKGLSSYSFTSVSSGLNLTTTIINQALTSIRDMSAHFTGGNSVPSNRQTGDNILIASYYTNMRDALNSIV